MQRIAIVAGARPNFMKIAPILRELDKTAGVATTLIHTGQHYDKNLSDVFFEELGIRQPDIALKVGSGSHAEQTADVMKAIEKTLVEAAATSSPFDRLVVVGDVNSTMAAAIAATKVHVPVAHVEAGLRSFDRSMPEEINRLLTDSISDMLLCSEPAGVENLRREGHDMSRVHLVGNVMIDTLMSQVERARSRDTLERLSLDAGEYGVVTLHRPSNVDDRETLAGLLQVLVEISARVPLVFPIHPRTRARVEAFQLTELLSTAPRLQLLEPQGYVDFLCLTSQAKVIVTDSGGLQEESTALGIPCLTMRANTERPITCEEGSGTLIGSSAPQLRAQLERVIAGQYKPSQCPELWDGKAAVRIAQLLVT
ncbi:non-hydrolyzing UDP-N-acetylglucosamine 2-epimerase [Aureliella helgolandensis]|uniref:UDP-2,3-diacetamido-2,3-dideoxy-D-glucuronate 2-epimerase n=1 Tax=Aureliella helgolandensis TaxID=2527968 RepID=A0A518GE43_9BACT|nr:UDP-N-acetylglucosamine 2-epimerase (non-hydrolyzing) [Aureliella helgolandensis]QDV26830.1 UDP-2,3-diacetamido-2,3-dideoxy-D-glucuronate 2-epimerase [Aureliella helgolandensis]